MDAISKRLGELRDEVGGSTIEKKKMERIEFMSNVMAGHEHRISLVMRSGRIKGTTERVQGHVHKVDLPVDEDGDVLGFTGIADQHKHRLKFKIKDFGQKVTAKGKDKDKKKK